MFNITQEAHNCGFDLVGVARAESLAQWYTPIFDYRLQSDYDDNISYMRRNVQVRMDPTKLFEGARSVIVCALSATNLGFNSQNRARIASYALCRDYHFVVKERLMQLISRLSEAYPNSRSRAFVDTAPLLEKAWAEKAGIGYIGRNSLLITREFGSRVFLGEIVTDIELPNTSPHSRLLSCAGCTACIDNCPTGAILNNGAIDTRRCISRNTIERVKHPSDKSQLYGWIFGCEICQQVCPHNLFVEAPRANALQPKSDPLSFEQWQTMDKESFDQIFGDTPLVRSGLQRLKSNL